MCTATVSGRGTTVVDGSAKGGDSTVATREDFFLAIRGDLDLATHEDSLMATDSPTPTLWAISLIERPCALKRRTSLIFLIGSLFPGTRTSST